MKCMAPPVLNARSSQNQYNGKTKPIHELWIEVKLEQKRPASIGGSV